MESLNQVITRHLQAEIASIKDLKATAVTARQSLQDVKADLQARLVDTNAKLAQVNADIADINTQIDALQTEVTTRKALP